MSRIVLLDAGPLGLVCNPRGGDEARGCKAWLKQLLSLGVRVTFSEVTDFEVRRELIRAQLSGSLWALNALVEQLEPLPVRSDVWRLAAELWAQARNNGTPTAAPEALDVDVILAAQARLIARNQDLPVIVATSNVGHLSRFVAAERWQDIA